VLTELTEPKPERFIDEDVPEFPAPLAVAGSSTPK
jgi:hypothetical protein